MILFKNDIEGPLELADLTNRIQRISFQRWNRPMIIAVDQEGGRVSRLREPFTQFSGMEELGARPDGAEKVKEYARITAFEMRLVGLNMNLAPVLDVRRGEVEDHLRGRTLSDSPVQAGVLGVHIIKTMQSQKVWCVGKHFPGLGKAKKDPHSHEVRIPCSIGELEEVDLVPFNMAIKAGVCGIMTSHAIYDCIDPDLPATFSEGVTKMLRKEFGFDGIIITDDLLMGAVTSKWEVHEAVFNAIGAGHDMVIISRQERIPQEVLRRLSSEDPGDERLREKLERARKNLQGIFVCIAADFRFSDAKEVTDYFHLDRLL